MTQDLKTIYSVTIQDKDAKPHHFAFKRPSRAEREDADMWHGAWVHKYLEGGLIAHALMIKRYADADGTFDKAQRAEYDSIRPQILTKEEELARAAIGTDLALRDRITNELLDLRERFIRLQQSQESFFANTAEAKARNRLIEWLVLHLSYHRVDESKPWEPFFLGDDTAAKIVNLEKMEESDDDLYLKSRDQMTFIAALWVSLGGNLKKEDIDAFLTIPKTAHDVAESTVVETLERAKSHVAFTPETQSQPTA